MRDSSLGRKTASAKKKKPERPTALSVLLDAKNLISPEGAWTTGANARDKNQVAVVSEDEDAVCWCADGAIIRAAFPHEAEPARRFLRKAAELSPNRPLYVVNDARGSTQSEILAWFGRALNLARKAQSSRPATK